MNKNELINHIRKNHDRIEVGNSQMDIICDYVKDYFETRSEPDKKGLIQFLALNNTSLELGNSQFELLADIIHEYES